MREILSTIVIFFVYIAVGCSFYNLMEEKPCESEDRLSADDYDEDNCMEPWTIIDALYFSMVTMSTVGYGDLTPTTDGSKAFTCVYIIIGITVVFVRVANTLEGVLGGIDRLFLHMIDRWGKSAAASGSGTEIDLTGDGEADFVSPPSSKVYWTQSLSAGCVVLVLIQFIAALVFIQIEPSLKFGDAMYHCFVTATTVGYGDVSLTRQETRLWAFFHIALSVAWLGAFISRVGELQAIRSAQLQRYQLLMKQVDEDLICSLDQDGTGVDKVEFVVGMLIKLGAQLCGSELSWSDVEPFLKRFDAIDVDGSGILTKQDLMEMVQKQKMERLQLSGRRGAEPKAIDERIGDVVGDRVHCIQNAGTHPAKVHPHGTFKGCEDTPIVEDLTLDGPTTSGESWTKPEPPMNTV